MDTFAQRLAIRSGLLALVLLVISAPATVCGAPPAPKSSAEIKRKHAELKRQAELKHRQMKAEHQRNSEQMLQDIRKRMRPPQDAPSSFNADQAPPPEECLKSYIAAARSATSMDQLLGYLPDDEQESLKQRQAQHDPKAAASRRQSHRQRSPDMADETLDFLTNPPYTNELNRHRRIAGKILAILSVKIDGHKAIARVSTKSGATVNGVHYPYGTAEIELLGQGNSWRIASYNDSNMAYLDPPR
jgi:hypothetical protein